MKPIRDIEETRRAQHADAQSDTVHRSSLLAPGIPGCATEISFLNHFLLKRGHREVACRLTAVGPDGDKLASRTYRVDQPRAYSFRVEELAEGPVANTVVEFFSPANLYVPFPAVVVNHHNDRFHNFVHSYNRVLNDVFEDDAVNAEDVREASIDVRADGDTDTFALFTAGPRRCRGEVELLLRSPAGRRRERVAVDLPRLTNRWISAGQVFGGPLPEDSVLTIRQPRQFLFYGRMLAGLHRRRDGAFAANHSFYDCSEIAEYWPDPAPSARVYPLFEGFEARIRLHPIFSPCTMLGEIDLLDASGRIVHTLPCEPLVSPGDRVLDVPVSRAATAAGVEDAVAMRYRAWPEAGPTPRRINHQVVYGPAEGRGLPASAAISLRNPNAFVPEGKTGLVWGQCAAGADLDSRLGLTLDVADGETVPVDLRWFDEGGEIDRRIVALTAGSAWQVDPAGLLPDLPDRHRYLWYQARCERSDLSAFSVIRHRRTGHCSADHSF